MPLSKNEIDDFKKQLIKLRAELSKNVAEVTQEVKDSEKATGYSQHQADQGTDDFVQNINLEVSNSEYEIIKSIDKALQKIDEGTYGICEVTGEEIPIKRLEAIPYATMTVKAQELRDKGLA